jgi:hypothetical protein
MSVHGITQCHFVNTFKTYKKIHFKKILHTPGEISCKKYLLMIHIHGQGIEGSGTMLDFETYVARHGEGWVQGIVERLERYEGIRANMNASLEERWASLMQSGSERPRLAA